MSTPAPPLARLLQDQEDRLLNCVHCGFCLPACPTYTRLGDEADSPRGRLHLMRAVSEGRLDPASDAFQTHIDRCLGCRACEPVCPSGVEYGILLESAREAAARERKPPLLARLLLSVMERPVLLALWGAGSRLLRATGLPALAARVLPGRGPLGSLRLGMAMLAASAPPRDGIAASKSRSGRRRPADAERHPGKHARPGREDRAAEEGGRREEGRVAILEGCVQSALFSRVNRDTREVLAANGFDEVRAAGQGCCGALHAHAGRLEEARRLARRNIRAFREEGVGRVVVNAAGCGAAMKDYGDLLEHDPEWADEARRFAAMVADVSEVLDGAGEGPRRGGALPVRVAYDPPCHLLHAQGVADPPLRLLRAIPGLELVPLENASECCGGAGLYGVTHPDLGGAITGDKVEAVARSGARVLATGNPGCMMQIGAGLRMSGRRIAVRHPVEILAESYRRTDAGGGPPHGGPEAGVDGERSSPGRRTDEAPGPPGTRPDRAPDPPPKEEDE